MTELEIINKALRRIGAKPASDMSDTYTAAAKAIAAYDGCRDEVLRMVNWPSVTKRVTMQCTADLVCQWIASHAYHVGDKVTNDTGKVYECTVAGTSAASGGPTGTSAAITDNTVTWEYVAADDTSVNWAWVKGATYAAGDIVGNYDGRLYLCSTAGVSRSTLGPRGTSTAEQDDAEDWLPDTTYVAGDTVTNGTDNAYICTTGGKSASSGGPTTTGTAISDNEAVWDYVGENAALGNAAWDYYGTIPDNLTLYAFAYVYPSDCLKMIKIPRAGAAADTDKGAMYTLEGRLIYTDEEDASLRYIHTCTGTNDPGLWDSLLQRAVYVYLAMTIAYDVTGKKDVQQSVLQEFALIQTSASKIGVSEGSEGFEEPVLWTDA